ncbi:MAG: HEAT repeat domain-containing protein [Deltaproteobacteria bacterium]|nr:MAG: HEAT repeat domain-containing protein [Deltaproteobacteria bacterium]
MPSLFAPVERIVEKYKHDVNRLAGPALPDALTSVEGHLRRALPPGLRTFLEQHNGASLLRGAVRIRAASAIAIAAPDRDQVVLFAEVQGEQWAYAPDGVGGTAFGTWTEGRLRPQHATFGGWLRATLAVTEARVTRDRDRIALRLEADADDPYQLLAAGERALAAGDPEGAKVSLERATSAAGTAVAAWHRLGDALAVVDRSRAREAWLRSFRMARLPLPYPGAPALEPDVFRSIGPAFADPEDYERELDRFLEEQASDIRDQVEHDLMVACGRQAARSRLRHGRRIAARDGLQALLERCAQTTSGQIPWGAALELATLQIELGHHDQAEALLRRVRLEGPPRLRGEGLLRVAEIATLRDEPWAEEVLDEALDLLEDPPSVASALALAAERALRVARLPDAKVWLDRAELAARPLGSPPTLARIHLLRADLEAAARDFVAAKAAIERGLAELARQDHAELRYRLRLRQADLAIHTGQAEKAYAHARAAVEGFAQAQLPVREAWALLRLARVVEQPDPLLRAARRRFEEADLASGIAAVDALWGDPGRSLDWHLQRATAHARARHDARRPRPPWTRADAERPERRLGAHRRAIAACGIDVVETLGRELDACARAMASGRTRAVDAPVLRYVAAVDLLAGHQSWRAAQLLLDHLVRQQVTGAARRALQGAVARSPNAALVDGLLKAIEQPDDHPASIVAEAAEALGLRREESALKALVALADQRAHPVSRKAAITALARIGDRSVVDAIVPALEDPVLEAPAALALLMLGDRRGVDFHARALSNDRVLLTVSPGEIVGRFGGSTHLLLLVNAARGQGEGALGALHGLGLLGDPRAVPRLLECLDRRDRRVQEVAAGALQILTGHHEQQDDPGWKTRWNLWWEQNTDRFPDGVRHRDGHVFQAGLLLARMEVDDPWVRRTAHDELVITTGVNIPFDADGPWRVQQAHLRAWRQWWAADGRRLNPGEWYLDGRPVV